MARDLNLHTKVSRREPAWRLVVEAALYLGLAAAASYAFASELLNDPTRPPAALSAPDAGIEPAAPAALQSVILRKGQNPIAIIGGERVELGQRYNGARLVKVSESEVVLVGPSGTETLRLTPAVDKTPAQKNKLPLRQQAPSPVQQKSLSTEANEK